MGADSSNKVRVRGSNKLACRPHQHASMSSSSLSHANPITPVRVEHSSNITFCLFTAPGNLPAAFVDEGIRVSHCASIKCG